MDIVENNIVDRLDTAFDKLCLSSYANKLPAFAGDKGGAGLMHFIEEFNDIANIMGPSEGKMVRLLPAHLKGTAKAVFESFTDLEKQNWRMAITKLKEHFSTDHFLDMAREKLMEMKMEPRESPVVFSSRLRKEILDAYPNPHFADKRQFLQHMIFTNAPPNPIKQRLKLLGPLSNDYDQLVRDAERTWCLINSDKFIR
ncbi:hypothetical protein V3C99_018391 [Haemonchus contortus]|uniref:Retrotrans_gag domain-containing protein n=1 Tax=Haemonchus contortus TaxID=6289 RepID=A0A7I4Z283_HAECO|nr:unnamed protein product [Haemonchus contortus]